MFLSVATVPTCYLRYFEICFLDFVLFFLFISVLLSLKREEIVRFFLILVSLFYVEVSVTRPVFHIWYCTRGFLFRLKNSSSAILI